MDKEKQIGYRPDLKYTDEYESDITFKKENEEDDYNQNDDGSDIDDLLEEGDAIQNMVDKLPDFLGDIIKDPLDPIIDFVKDELDGKEVEKVPVELEWDYIDNEFPEIDPEGGDEEYDDPDIGIWDPDDFIPIKKEEYTKEQIMEKEYVKNLYDLFSDYYSNLHTIVSNFWSSLLYSIMNKNSSEIETIMNNILLSSSEIKKDQKHLLDLSIKSQINRDMKLKYFSNNFDAEGSMTHLKQFKAVHELRLRYAKINKNDNPISRADQMSNNMLKSMSLSYDAKYDKAFESLYRYLKSSNMVLDDALRSATQSIRAKQTLIDTKGVK